MAYAGSLRSAVGQALQLIANSEAYLAWPYSMTRVCRSEPFLRVSAGRCLIGRTPAMSATLLLLVPALFTLN